MRKNEKITNFGVPKMVIFRTFSEKVDFTKIGVSPRREHDFWGPDPSKNSKKSAVLLAAPGVLDQLGILTFSTCL